ncbi:MAG TPA: ribonuclease Z [Gemmatimonadales bacterium]|nr:ribonuclease Z [Gemmatimonadales bacterium]
MHLVTVGTGTVAPSAARTAACHWVERGDLRLLLDCGAGSLHRLAEFGLDWPRLTHVALSHFHPDHFGEVPMLVYALKYATVPPRRDPLTILGPPGLGDLLSRLARGFGDWLLAPGFGLEVHEIQESEIVHLDAEVRLETFPVPHTGESVALSVTGPEGRLVYTGDTGPSDELARWARDCDLLLAECSLPESLAMDIHLTPERAGDLARAAAARRLVLTHFYPPVETTDPARAAAARFGGPVTAARDGERFTIGGRAAC